ncbi:hypothetical protein U472_08555 [Orenia metallireducens]|uniref:Uncharacterized protein n=2 Tax=Orenia metallireducens TaxID=1413210 RepID=A0A1C0A728_9FIRM|nr:hypothetical protein U472_08555 [Orenia metallireducens]
MLLIRYKVAPYGATFSLINKLSCFIIIEDFYTIFSKRLDFILLSRGAYMNFYLYQFKWLIIASIAGLLIAFFFVVVPEGFLYDVSGRDYGEDGRVERFTSVTQLKDSSLLIIGYSKKGFNTQNKGAYLLKVALNGSQGWSKSFSEEGNIKFNGIQEVSDSGVILVGEKSLSANSKVDAYILKVDKQGNKKWSMQFGDKYADSFKVVKELRDGSLLIGGKVRIAQGEDSFNEQAYLVKLDKDGKQEWIKEFGGEYYDGINSIKEALDGGIVLVGYYGTDRYMYSRNAYIIKLDSVGNQQWSKIIGEEGYNSSLNSVIENKEGELILVGQVRGKEADSYGGYIVKLNSNGDKLWTKVYQNQEEEDYYLFTDIAEAEDDYFIIVGYKLIFIEESSDYRHVSYVSKIDESGQKKWTKSFRSSYQDGGFNSISKVDNGDFILAGWIQDRQEVDGYLLKIDSKGNEVKFEKEQD